VSCRRNGIILHWKKSSLKKRYIKSWRKKHATWDKVLEAIDDAFKPFKKAIKKRDSQEKI
jgi:topoisomerase-4 subunit A